MSVHGGVEDLVTVRQAAALADRTPETIRRWVWSGRLPARREDNRLLVARDDVARLVRRAPAQGGGLQPSSLQQWADEVSRRLTDGVPGSSSADLVLADRAEREGARASR